MQISDKKYKGMHVYDIEIIVCPHRTFYRSTKLLSDGIDVISVITDEYILITESCNTSTRVYIPTHL